MTSYIGLALLICIAVNSGQASDRVYDLTHAHSPDAIYWPMDPAFDFNFKQVVRGRQENGNWVEMNYFSTLEHGGTHADAPAHFFKGQWRTQQIPIEKLIGPGVVINVKEKAAHDPDYRVTVDDLHVWETKFGRIPDGAVVLMNSGWASKYPNKTLVFGSDTPTDPSTFHFPAFHPDAADWLTIYRNVHVVGVDTPSVDYGQSKDFMVHVILGRENIIGVENVANLDRLPEAGTTVYVGLIKLFDGSGGPARVFATDEGCQRMP